MSVKQSLVILAVLTAAAATEAAVPMEQSPVRRAMQAELSRNASTSPIMFARSLDDEEFRESTPKVGGQRKSIFKAVLYSSLIPGGGQYYLGKRKTARYFFAAEALTWLGYLSFKTYGDWRRDDYIAYAATHANADLEGKSDDYLSWVGFYNSIREFNSFGRAWDPERAYLPDTPENHWEWQSEEERQTYRDLRNGSLEAYRRSDFMIGIAILDRVVSIIDAVRSARRLNQRIDLGDTGDDHTRWVKLAVNPLSSRRQVCVTFYPGF